ncbi:replication restart helicase PriA [Fuerstiella marisgermanici]|uniref:Replication restart protein PriA n=1 Tax=Fuerstiella marisgermanici TaxID=1891926 RepID=A0A1P8WCS7_9PLAN|nr:primosomal protein N' [Fuerstiella marisgermanici]APZ91863.1 Primosomal protein N' [Fuerstiella marisgermanici]
MSDQQGLFEFADLPEWEQAAAEDLQVAEVVFNLPLEKPYTYSIPDEFRELLKAGMRVKAPLGRGNRTVVGYCVNVRQAESAIRKLKPIHEVLDSEPLLNDVMLKLTHWIGERYLCGWGQVLDSVIPAGVRRKSGTRLVQSFELSSKADQLIEAGKLPKKQQTVVDVLREFTEPVAATRLCELAECGPGPITALRKKGIVTALRIRSEVSGEMLEDAVQTEDLILNSQQQQTLDKILSAVRSGEHSTMLLHGVTGSGKTEVYIRSIREIVSYGRQAIVLVPEISLTPQTIRRFRCRFKSVAVLHSHMTDSERHWQWQQIAQGQIEVVVGARSAVFAPTPNLGLIVIDEEHEPTFKQDSTPRYHAREVARYRCMQERVPLLLGSATPTLESWLRATRRQDTLLSMPDRVAELPLPPVVVVDTRNDPRIGKGSSLGRALFTSIGRALNEKGQVILFLNLRGYSPTVWCRSCGTGVKCPDCDITLTWHRDRAEAVCHSCDYSIPAPEKCPTCESAAVRYFGTGTQKLEAEVAAAFPAARVLRMDSDSMRKPGSHDEALEKFRHGEVEILLGTQMIAKGLDFPNVTLVGVIDADSMLNQPDMRASERTFQLIAQVAGRTGRSSRGGRVLVQTTNADAPSIKYASKHDFMGFAYHELQQRKETGAPPFSTVTRVIFRGMSEPQVCETAREVANKLRTVAKDLDPEARILGAAPAPITRLRGYYRFHLQIAAPSHERVKLLWQRVEGKLKLPDSVEMAVDVDPINSR